MKRTLIVVSNRSTISYVWAIEHGMRLRNLGVEVSLLDLAGLEGRYISRRIRWWVDLLSYKNSMPRMLSIIADKNSFNLISWKDLKSKDIETEIDLTKNLLFENTLRSQFSKWFGSSAITLRDIPKRIVKREIKSFEMSYNIVNNILNRNDFDDLVTINGRFIVEVASILAAKENNVTYGVLENLTNNDSNYSFSRKSIHSVVEMRRLVKETWLGRESDKESRSIAESHILKRDSPLWPWKFGNSSSEIGIDAPYIAFYPTSDHEFAVIIEENELLPEMNQTDCFKLISNYCVANSIQLVVRVHPQGRDIALAKKENELWQSLCAETKSFCILSNQPVDSMALAKSALVNVVFASSIGVEFAYNQLPLVICAPTTYSQYIPECEAFSAVEILLKLADPPITENRTAVLPWAYFQEEGGTSISKFKVDSVYEIFYGAIQIDKPRKSILCLRNFRVKLINRILGESTKRNHFEL